MMQHGALVQHEVSAESAILPENEARQGVEDSHRHERVREGCRVGGFPAHAVIRSGEIIRHDFEAGNDHRVGGGPAHPTSPKKNAAEYAAFLFYLLLPGPLKYLKNSEFESITITSPCALKLAR